MKIKYFVRGLGIGILVTTLILGISYKSKNSDEDVIIKAKKLGMVFAEDVSGSSIGIDEQKTDEPPVATAPSVIEKPTKKPDEEQTTEPDAASTEEPVTAEPAVTPTDEPVTGPTAEPTADPAVEPTAEPVTDPAAESELISFSVERGDWSRIVSEKLEGLGIIDDSEQFDKYLVDNGYAVRIKVGNFKAKKGSTYEEIAKMITGKS